MKLAKAFGLPTVITTSAPDGPVPPVITQTLPHAPIMHRPGEINAWHNKAFVEAVKKTGRMKPIVAGVSTRSLRRLRRFVGGEGGVFSCECARDNLGFLQDDAPIRTAKLEPMNASLTRCPGLWFCEVRRPGRPDESS